MRVWLSILFVSMSSHCTKYLLCYDICDPKRLRRVHRLVRDWGVPIQFSMFEIEVNSGQLESLIVQLTDLMNPDEDKVMFYRLNPKQARICLGIEVQTEDLLFV